jgi:CRP-like cAMP-binding protein
VEFQNHLLCQLSAEVRTDIAERGRHVRFRHGEIIQGQGERRRHCVFVESGLVALTRMLTDGSRVEAGLVGREGLIGSISAPAIAFTEAKAETAVEAISIESSVLHALASQDPVLRDVLARYHQYQLEEAQLNAVCNASHHIEARLAKWLLRCLDRVDTLTLKLTQELLAEMLGVQRTTVTAALQRLVAAGVLRTGRANIEVLDRARLEAASCECYAHAAERLPELGLPEATDRSVCPAD